MFGVALALMALLLKLIHCQTFDILQSYTEPNWVDYIIATKDHVFTVSNNAGYRLAQWDLATSNLITAIPNAHTAAVTGLGFGLDDTLIFTSSMDGTIKSWWTGNSVSTLLHSATFNLISGVRLMAIGNQTIVTVMETGIMLQYQLSASLLPSVTLVADYGQVTDATHMAFNPPHLLLARSINEIVQINTQTRQNVRTILVADASFYLQDDDRFWFAALRDLTLVQYNTSTGQFIQTIPTDLASGMTTGILTRNHYYFTTRRGHVYQWDINQNAFVESRLKMRSEGVSMTLSRDRKRLYVGCYKEWVMLDARLADSVTLTRPKGATDTATLNLVVPRATADATTSHASSQSNLPRGKTTIDLIQLIASTGGFVVLAASGCTYCYCTKRTSRPKKAKSSQTNLLDILDSNTAIDEQIVITANNTSSIQTLIATTHEMSIPAFLEMKWGTDFRQEEVIGKGGLATIYKCTPLNSDLISRTQGETLVCKVISHGHIEQMSERNMAGFFQELSLMHRFRDSEYFPRVFAYSTLPVAIVMRYYHLGDLMQYANGRGKAAKQYPYTKSRVVTLIKQLCLAVGVLHKSGLSHSDIKPANVLLDEDANKTQLKVILCDFGLTRAFEPYLVDSFYLSDINGFSPVYAAPEVFQRFRNRKMAHSQSVYQAGDVFALAVSMYELLRQNPHRQW